MRRIIVAAVVGISAGSAVLASAAALNVSTSLGTGSAVTATCDDAVATSLAATFDPTEGYQATGLVVSGIAPACNGQSVGATVTDLASSPLVVTATSVTVTNSAATVTLPFPSPLPVRSVLRAYVVIG